MDALALLTADHNRVRGLFHRFKSAKEQKEAGEIGALQEEIFTDLVVHTAIEEEIFYPWARNLSEDIAETIDEGIQEHHVVKVLMEEIGSLEPSSDEAIAKMTVLIENVEHHAEEEEEELFPDVRSAASANALEELTGQLEARKKELGAPVLADKIDLTVTELKQLATEQEIPGRSSMDHEELAATVAPPR
ncbi:MAG TPA: hemerythrin domain-containing protein [Mycobacteriales bacterium]|nr:hemerythrin domain-containing protein [Mycobacteriales bacterium]